MSCPSCDKPYAGAGGADDRKAVILPCICRICKGCARTAEAGAQQQQQTKTGKGKGKGKEPMEYIPTPCINCKTLSTTPVNELLLDMVVMRAASGGAAEQSVPPCDVCEGEATKFCAQCAKTPFLCDGCHKTAHQHAKKQGHTWVPVKEHLASAPAHTAGGGGSAGAGAAPRCRIHADKILEFASLVICLSVRRAVFFTTTDTHLSRLHKLLESNARPLKLL